MFTKIVDKIKTKLLDRKFEKMPVVELWEEQEKGVQALIDNDWDKFLTHFHIKNTYLLHDSIEVVVQTNNFDLLLKLREIMLTLANGQNFFYGAVISESIKADNLEMFQWGYENYGDKDEKEVIKHWKDIGGYIFNPHKAEFVVGRVAHFYIMDDKTDKNWLSQFSAFLKNREAHQFIESSLDKLNLNSQIKKQDIKISEKMPDKPFKV